MPVGDDTFAYRRDLPHLSKTGKTYFITFCTADRRVLSGLERTIALTCIVRDHRVTCWIHSLVIMPDHVHIILTPYENFALKTIMQRIKSVSSHEIGHGTVWQREYFDTILRSDEDLRQKCEYICENPVRAGIVARVEDYPWIWRSWIEGRAGEGAGAPLSLAEPH